MGQKSPAALLPDISFVAKWMLFDLDAR